MTNKSETLPEPVAIDLDREHELFGQWFKDRYGYAPDMNGDSGPARWAAWLGRSELAASTLREAIKGARLKALEEAAAKCESMVKANFDYSAKGAARDCASAVQRLMEDEQ